MAKRKKKHQVALLLAMIALILAAAVGFLFIGLRVSEFVKELNRQPAPQQGFQNARFSLENLDGKQLDPADIEVAVDGIPGIHGLGVFDGTLYVSSWTKQALYKVDVGNGYRRQLTDEVDGIHDMVMEGNAIVTPVFGEDRLVKVDKGSGQITILARDLAGPNGIAKARDGGYYVSNAKSGTVVKISSDGKDVRQIASGLKEPAGIISDTDNILYVAQYSDPANSVIQIFDNGKIQPLVGGMTQAETLLRDDRRNLIIGHSQDGKAAFSFFKRGGTTAQPLLRTNLPGPVIGPVSDERYLYFASIGDSKVYKIRLP
jgi:hypothetical protein